MLVQTARTGFWEQKNVGGARQNNTSLIQTNSSKKGIKTLPPATTKVVKE
jgi:hypothetical protein